MCISCRQHVDVHKGEGVGVDLMWTHVAREGDTKQDFLVEVING